MPTFHVLLDAVLDRDDREAALLHDLALEHGLQHDLVTRYQQLRQEAEDANDDVNGLYEAGEHERHDDDRDLDQAELRLTAALQRKSRLWWLLQGLGPLDREKCRGVGRNI